MLFIGTSVVRAESRFSSVAGYICAHTVSSSCRNSIFVAQFSFPALSASLSSLPRFVYSRNTLASKTYSVYIVGSVTITINYIHHHVNFSYLNFRVRHRNFACPNFRTFVDTHRYLKVSHISYLTIPIAILF